MAVSLQSYKEVVLGGEKYSRPSCLGCMFMCRHKVPRKAIAACRVFISGLKLLLSLQFVVCLTCARFFSCSGFLDKVCTDIIHYQNRQLRRYVGNLSEFVKAVPTAKSYYELEAATLKFRFPVPGLLDGISSKEKPICKLTKVEFAYPGEGGAVQLVRIWVHEDI